MYGAKALGEESPLFSSVDGAEGRSDLSNRQRLTLVIVALTRLFVAFLLWSLSVNFVALIKLQNQILSVQIN